MNGRVAAKAPGRFLLAAGLLLAGAGVGRASGVAGEDEIRRLVDSYAKAIETKDVSLFRTLKPNLSGEEEQRLVKAFASVHSQQVSITIESIDAQGEGALVRLSRRDVLDGSIVSHFVQTLKLSHGRQGWTIEAIGR